MNQSQLLSHCITPQNIADQIDRIRQRIIQEGDKPHVSINKQLEILHQLAQFDFGRFLIQNQGINGYWTHYMLTYPWYGAKTDKNHIGEPLTPFEKILLERMPVLLATQQRFKIFLEENQKAVINNAALACIPCGMLGELLYLDLSGISTIELIGIDYDQYALQDARNLAESRGLNQFIHLEQADAWAMDNENQFDLISSNGLNIYEPSDERVQQLYQNFYHALKPGGKLVTSYLTIPAEWDMSKINSEDLLLQRIIFADVLQAKWQCMRPTELTKAQLTSVGFQNIEFLYDEAKIFPTVVAYK